MDRSSWEERVRGLGEGRIAKGSGWQSRAG